jgi:hypothetical protein
MRIRPVFAWYDMWIGAYWDREATKLYVLPVPCIGFSIQFGPLCDVSSSNCTGGYHGKCTCERIDTSDIPEQTEDWFRRAKLRLPK